MMLSISKSTSKSSAIMNLSFPLKSSTYSHSIIPPSLSVQWPLRESGGAYEFRGLQVISHRHGGAVIFVSLGALWLP